MRGCDTLRHGISEAPLPLHPASPHSLASSYCIQRQCAHFNQGGNRRFSCFTNWLFYHDRSHQQNVLSWNTTWMDNQTRIAATPDPARVPPVPVSTPPPISFTTHRFPAWMGRHHTWIVSVVAVIALLTLLCMGWAARTVQDRLIQSAGHSLVQAATDAASKLDMMVLERYGDIQLLSTATIAQGQDPEALTRYLRELLHAYPDLSVDWHHRLTREDHRGNRSVRALPRSKPESLVPTGTHPHRRQDSGCAGE